VSAANKVFDDDEPINAQVVEQSALVPHVNRGEKEHLQSRAVVLANTANSLVVTSQDTLDIAREFLDELMQYEKQVASTFNPHIESANALHKSLCAERKKFLDPVENAKSIVKPKIGTYLREQDRIRLEAQRKKALEEEQARRLAEVAVDKAHALMKEGDDAAAEAIINETHKKVETLLTKATEVPDKPDAKGISLRQKWTYRVIDETKIPRKYLVPDWKKIAFIVSKLHEQADIEGIEPYAEDIVAAKLLD